MRGGEDNKVFLLESFGAKPVKTEQMDKKHSVSLNLKTLCLYLHYLMIIQSQWPPLKFCSLFQPNFITAPGDCSKLRKPASDPFFWACVSTLIKACVRYRGIW